MQIIINKQEGLESMILTYEEDKKVFVKNSENADTKEAELMGKICDLVSNYFSDGKL